MLQQRTARLFHGVVLAGSALGCGARASDASDGSATRAAMEPPGAGPGNQRAAPPRVAAAPAAPTVALSPSASPAPFAGGEEPAIGEPVALPGSEPAPNCRVNQQRRCEGQGSSAALGCRCVDVIPLSAFDCAQPEQFQCSDAGAGACRCDTPDAGGCPPGELWYCGSYEPLEPCACLTIRIR